MARCSKVYITKSSPSLNSQPTFNNHPRISQMNSNKPGPLNSPLRPSFSHPHRRLGALVFLSSRTPPILFFRHRYHHISSWRPSRTGFSCGLKIRWAGYTVSVIFRSLSYQVPPPPSPHKTPTHFLPVPIMQ